MSGLRVPIFSSSILVLIVLVIQNRAPVYQLTILGMRLRPLGLGFLVAIAVLSGLVLGALLQRLGGRQTQARPARSKSSNREFQTTGNIPQEPDFNEETTNSNRVQTPSESSSDTPNSEKAKGWNATASSSWTESTESESFWTRKSKQPNRQSDRSNGTEKGSVTPLPRRDRRNIPEEQTMVDAEYRVVTPLEQTEDDFDDDFFDDFFDEDQP